MIRINPDKLLRSKWTAVSPENKEKHFLVTRLVRDDNDKVVRCEIESVYSRNTYRIDWTELKNTEFWMQGWR